MIDTASLVGAGEATGTREWLKARVLQMVEDESDIDPDENLIFYGLDSLQVMKLAGELKERGVTVGFDELARVPTLSAWWALIDQKRLAAVAHALCAVGAILIWIVHVYAAIWVKGTLRAMTQGTVSGGWAWKHHRKWFRQEVGKS